MSVYTLVGPEALADWLRPLPVGALVDHVGIAAGMQNSNYFVTTATGRYVLTVFENIEPALLDAYLRLQSHLADRGLPCPRPLVDDQGQRWRLLCGKPAALLTCLAGSARMQPTSDACAEVGRALARLHLAGADLSDMPANPCGAAWRSATAHELLPLLPPADRELLADELVAQAALDLAALPQGVIHADLFRDNVLWTDDGRLSGLLDFYFAGIDAWLFDLAVVANDWGSDPALLAALIAGYQEIRPLQPAERTAWPMVRRAAALRFWLLRLDARHRPRPGAVVTVKDPDEYRRLLTHLRLAPEPLPG